MCGNVIPQVLCYAGVELKKKLTGVGNCEKGLYRMSIVVSERKEILVFGTNAWDMPQELNIPVLILLRLLL